MPRSLMIFAALIPLAILLGVMLATPMDANTMLLVGVVFIILLTPILLRHHHAILIFSWGAFVNAFFLPAQPPLWLVMVFVSLFFSVLTRTLNRDATKFLKISSLNWGCYFFGAVILITAKLTGGIGLRSLGSEVYGGKRYFFLLGGLLLYFALAGKPIEKNHRQFYAKLFFATGITAVVSNIAYTLGPSFYFLFLLFPTDWAMQQAYGDMIGPTLNAMTRISGLSPACTSLASLLLVRYGLTGVLDPRNPLRPILFGVSIVGGLFSGFRSHLVVIGLLIIVLFFLEKLYRTKWLPISLIACGLVFGFLAAFSTQLPLTMQRSLAVLPIKVDPIAAQDAKASSEWRVDMWRIVVMDLPKYLLVGKGYSLDPTDILLTEEAARRGQIANYESSIIVGDYHNGPLTVIMTFGVFGSIGFLWIIFAGGSVLWKNYRYGDPEIANINSFLLGLFIARLLFFMVIYGSLQADFFLFTGLFGFSVAVNHGVRKREDLQEDLAGSREPAEEDIIAEEPLALPLPGFVRV